MIVTLTAKVKIMPTEAQAEAMLHTVSAYRVGCNYISSVVCNGKVWNQRSLHERTYQHLRTAFGLRSQMAQSAMRTVIARYKAIRSNGHAWTQVQFKKPEYDLVWNRDYSLTAEWFSVGTLQGRIKVPYERKGMQRYFDGIWRFGTAKLVCKHRKWYLYIPMSKEIEEPKQEEIKQVVGIDLGINFLATSFNSQGKTEFYPGRQVKRKRAQYKRLRQQLEQKQTSSSRRRLKKIGQRENRYMTDVNHKVSKALVRHYGANTLFVMEDLTGIRKQTERVRVRDRYVSVSWAFYQLRKMVEYKAQLAGAVTIAVDPKYTSRECPRCNHQEKANRDKKRHEFCCKTCGYRSNDDRIAAMNLLAKGYKYLEEVQA